MSFTVFYKVGMKIKQTILSLAVFIGIGCFYLAPTTLAANCGGVTTSVIDCTQSGGTCSDGSKPVNAKCANGATYTKPEINDTGVWGILLLIINILTAGVGVVAVGGVVYAAILYATSRGSVEQTKKSIEIMQNVTIGIMAYVLMFAFLNYIIPGGLFQT
jgi:hypothetical protein